MEERDLNTQIYYCVAVFREFKRQYSVSEQEMLQLIKGYKLCDEVVNNIDYYDSSGFGDTVVGIDNILKRYGIKIKRLHKPKKLTDSEMNKTLIEDEIDNRIAFLIEHIVTTRHCDINTAYCKVARTRTYHMLNDINTGMYKQDECDIVVQFEQEVTGEQGQLAY